MKKRLLLILLLCLTLLHPSVSQSDPSGTLEITFTGVRNNKGLIAIGINSSPEGWPRVPQKKAHWYKTGIAGEVFTARIENLSFGTYAISVLDDENENFEMDMFMGIPKEGFGFSGNPRVKLSPPKFEDCQFDIEQPFQQITIDIRYISKGK
jgi:uncharacterized protein (DUF2141 family)